MEENRPQMVTTETASNLPILIVDKKGTLGQQLADSLKSQLLIVFATGASVPEETQVIHIPFKRRVPRLPDNNYSHIFVFYNGESEILDMLSSFVQKAHDTNAKLIFITSLTLSSEKLFKRLHKYAHPALQIVLYGEIFDNALSEPNELNFFLHQVRTYGKIEIPNEGDGLLYPVHIDDVLLGITTVAFRAERQFKTYFLFPQHPFSQFSIARILQSIDPDIKIDYKKKKYKKLQYYIPHGVVLLANYRLEARLKQIDLTRQKHAPHIPQKKIKLVSHDPQAGRDRVKLGFLLFFSIFIAPLFLTLLLALSGAGFLTQSVKHIEATQFASAQRSAQAAQYSFTAADALSQSLVLPAILMPQQKTKFESDIQTGIAVAETEVAMLESIQQLQGIYEGTSLDPKNDFMQALATLKNTLLTVQKLKAEGKLPESVERKLETHSGTLQLLEGTIDTWPALFGFEGKKTYLLLFQNNMELRPGGGFIGSYGILEVENGQMEDLTINDVYDADGKLKTHIEPPYGLRRYLGASHWYLRDSNFALDFRENALQASQFLNLETGQSVDGIIAIDTTFLKNLLDVLGSVKVSEYNETVTPENFYLLTQTYVEEDFFPGSTQKKDFLRSLSNAMMNALFEKRQFSYEKLLLQIEQSFRSKHLMVAFADNGVQNVFTVNGLSSALQDSRQEGSNTFLDFLSVVDANVGANKANFYVKRSINQEVTITPAGALQTSVETVYHNTSEENSPFGGSYNNYIRFVLPSTAQVQSILIDGVAQEVTQAVTDPVLFTQDDFVPPPGLEVNESFVQGKKVVGFFFAVPIGDTKRVRVNYTTPRVIKTEETAFTYNLRLFKQPGTLEDPYSLTLSYPPTFALVNASEGVSDLGGKFVYESVFNQDTDISATFSKK